MDVVVPYAAEEPKTRLESVLTPEERRRLSRTMLEDVLAAIRETGREPTVLATRPMPALDARVTVDDRPLTPAVNGAITDHANSGQVAVVMADLPLATSRSLGRLFETAGDVVAVPGRGLGTNALVVRDPSFRVDYHGGSFLDHREIADENSLRFQTVDSYRLSTDVDEPTDLVEVLVHGRGRTPSVLRDLGVELDRSSGRVGIVRRER